MPPLKVDLEVASIAKRWSNSSAFARLMQAVVKAEGNILVAVRKSIPSCKDRTEALEILARSLTHAMIDYLTGMPDTLTDYHPVFYDFIVFWRNRWAPLGAGNDPANLNVNWASNVLKFWRQA